MIASRFSKRLLFLPITTRYYLSGFENLGFKFLSVVSESNLLSDSTRALDFLVNSCGLSPEKAVSAAEKIRPTFKTKNPYSVLNFLGTSGFTKTQIAKLISIFPRLLFVKVETTMKPRIKLFQDIGLFGSQVAELIASNPYILTSSINYHIVPNLEWIRGFVHTDENMMRVIKRCNSIITSRNRFRSCISVLRECNVSDSHITYMLMNQPGNLMVKPEVLKGVIENVHKVGFNPESKMFVVAMNAMCSMSKSTWDSKVKLLKEWGWSEEQILHAFKTLPYFMCCSETKMTEGLVFYAKTLKWDASVLSKHPMFLLFSLRSRIIPRLKVFKTLISKKLLGEKLLGEEKKLVSLFAIPEKAFFKKFVAKYQGELPDIVKTYDGLCSNNAQCVDLEMPEEANKDTVS